MIISRAGIASLFYRPVAIQWCKTDENPWDVIVRPIEWFAMKQSVITRQSEESKKFQKIHGNKFPRTTRGSM